MSGKQNSAPELRYEIKALGQNEAEITIYGDIGENFWEPELSNAGYQLVQDIKAIQADYITVRISSHGGSVKDALEIVNALRRHPAAVTTEIDAVAFSAASMIAIGGADTVRMSDNALLMIHAPSTGHWGNAQEMRRAADMLDKYAEAMAQVYVRNGVTAEDALALLTDGEDHYFTAAEAKDAGYIDEITESMPIAASLDLSRYQSLPAAAAAFTQSKENVMPDKPKNPAANNSAKPEDEKVVDLDKHRTEVTDEVTAAIKARNNKLIVMKRLSNNPSIHAEIDNLVADISISEAAAMQRIEDMLGDGAEPANPRGSAPRIQITEDVRDKRITGMSHAILARVGAEKHDTANEFRGMKLHEIARASLEAAGVNTRGMDIMDIAEKSLQRGIVRGAQTTSDFDVILENTMHKLVLMGFNGVQPIYQRVCKIGDVTDFRDWRRIVPGLIGNLQSVNESGEYLDKNIPDGEKNTIAASRRGNIINITPEVIVNDDTGYINDMATGLGAAGPRTIDRALATLLALNSGLGPTLSDSKSLFHADHGNLVASGSGAAPSIALLDSAATSMAAQTAPGDDAEPLDISPEVALVPRALRGTMYEVVNAEFNDEATKNQRKPNRVRGIVSDIVATTRLSSATGWYLFADPMVAPVLEVVFLNGQREPRVVQEENFRTSGMAVKVEMPFGVGAIDYRGGFLNFGA